MSKSKFSKMVMGILIVGAASGSFVQAQSLCPGQDIPDNKSNQLSNLKLTCTIGTKSHPRLPVEIPKDQWYDWSDTKDNQSRETAQKMRLSDPAPTWRSDLPVQVYQEWDWVSVYMEQNGAYCGYHNEPQPVVVEDTEWYCPPAEPETSSSLGTGSSRGGSTFKYESSQSSRMNSKERAGSFESRSRSSGSSWKSGSGASRRRPNSDSNCYLRKTGKTHTEIRQVSVANTCPVPHVIHEKQFCNTNRVPYVVQYQKPDINNYNPKSQDYFDALPNKYDLLPGEWEKIHVNGQSKGTFLSVSVDIENEWNNYTGKDAQVIPCQLATMPELRFNIATLGRKMRKAPKVLAIPIDENGEPQPAVLQNVIVRNGQDVKTTPYKLVLQDASSAVIRSMAEDGRHFGAETDTATLNGGGKVMSFRQSPFWQDTRFRIKLYKKGSLLARAVRMSQPIHTDSTKVVSAEDLSLVEIPLDSESSNIYQASGPMEKWLGWLWARIPVRLAPGTDYEFRISSYQNGVPFYEGGCKNDDDPYCHHDEFKDAAFSEELIVPFSTEETYDDRTWLNKLFDMPR